MSEDELNNILGISSMEYYGLDMHTQDSSLSWLENGKILGSVAEERFSKHKNHTGFPWASLHYFFSEYNKKYDDIEMVALPGPLQQSLPKYKAFAKKIILNLRPGTKARKFAKEKLLIPIEKKKFHAVGHHQAHAADAYYPSGYKDAIAFSLGLGGIEADGVSASGASYLCQNDIIERIKLFSEGSFGSFYSYVTDGLGFRSGQEEYKTMHLSSLGNPNTKAYEKLLQLCPSINGTKIVKPKKPIAGGLFSMNSLQRTVFYNTKIIQDLIKRYSKNDVAAAAQKIIEEHITKLVGNTLDDQSQTALVLSGGIFHNVKLNKKLAALDKVKNIFISSNPGNGGTGHGAVLQAYGDLLGQDPCYKLSNAGVGPQFIEEEILATLNKYKNKINFSKSENIAVDTADLIHKGKIVGWFQGKMEFSQKGLGNRSVLCDPSNLQTKDRLNLILKKHEEFIPFGASILFEKLDRYVEKPIESQFMSLSFDIVKNKEELAAVTHVDETATIQTVTKEANGIYYDMIKAYETLSGKPAVLNTSFNRKGLPIVCSPEDAIQHVLGNYIEALAIGNYMVTRN
tara:strand:+ start:383 stop:2092 length:1710 start_codon:yes stop_codon:yes gene_type:complete